VPDDLAINIFHAFAIRCSTLKMNSNNEVLNFSGGFCLLRNIKIVEVFYDIHVKKS